MSLQRLSEQPKPLAFGLHTLVGRMGRTVAAHLIPDLGIGQDFEAR